MAKIQSMTTQDLEQFIEHNVREIIGDPDSGLQLREEFKATLQERLKKPSKRTPHKEVLKEFA